MRTPVPDLARLLRRADDPSRLILALVALVFCVPALVLVVGPTPGRLGFQMYSGYGEASATWVDAEGASHGVELGDHLGSARVEVDWTTRLPSRLCARIDGAVSVEVRQTAPGGDRIGRLTCPR